MLIKPQGVTNSFTLLTMQLWKVSLIGSESGFINLWFLLLKRVVCGHQQQVLDFWRGKFANFLFLAPQVKAVIVIMLKLLWKYPLFFWFGDYLYCLLVMLISLLLLLYDIMMYCTWGFTVFQILTANQHCPLRNYIADSIWTFILVCRMVRVVFLHPDLGIGGAERLVVDAAVALKSKGCNVQIWTAHYDPTHCFSETLDPNLPVVC